MASKKEETKLSPKLDKIVSEIEGLSVLELSELVGALQDRLGVQAAPVAPSFAPQSGATAGQASGGAPAAPEALVAAATQTVVLTNAGANKIGVIKALREINPNLGLKEAKDTTEKLPAEVLKDAKAEDAQKAVQKLEGAGATVELK